MNDKANFGFGKFVPGFDFLQNIAKGGQGMPQMPNVSSWIAPTLNVEELERRISELKAVQFWLDQNGKALTATIQALELQKMTLATLRGMNFSMNEVADALKMKPAKAPARAPEAKQPQPEAPQPAAAKTGKGARGSSGDASAVDPLQWWGALTQQFQEIASNAMQDVAQKTEAGRKRADAASPAPAQAAKKAPARKAAAKKTRSRT